MVRPVAVTAPQRRAVDELLGWGVARPVVADQLVERLLDQLTGAVGGWLSAREQVPTDDRRPLLITKTRLTRLVCDGLQAEPTPYEHRWANVRGTLAHAAIEADVAGGGVGGRDLPEHVLAASAWDRLATDRPGDPASVGAWLNARDAGEREQLLSETQQLLASFREVWPVLDGAPLHVRTEARLVAMLGGRAIRLQGVPDLVIGSPVRDGRARTLIVDLKTGMPRGQQDRDELRFYALLSTLAEGVPPFRWATLYVTEGRIEHEDLSDGVLLAAALRVADAIEQATRMRLLQVGLESEGERLEAGDWCERCRRRPTCPVALARYGGPVTISPT
jgi:hypothetical protein